MKSWLKNILIFAAGMATTVVIAVLISPSSDRSNRITWFPEKGDCISKKQFRVFQVLEPNAALASELSFESSVGQVFGGTTVLFLKDEGKFFYDDEKIKVPSGKCVRQVGVYTYPTKNQEVREYKTVPVVKID